MENARDEIKSQLYNLGVYVNEPCTDEENKQLNELKKKKQQLPEGIYEYEENSKYYRLVKTDLSEDEMYLKIPKC